MKRNRDTRRDEPERFDIGQLHQQRDLERAKAAAAEAASIPPAVHRLVATQSPRSQRSPLAALLDALGPLRTALMPPIELVASHDQQLAAMMREATQAHEHAYRLAHEWVARSPGGRIFADATAGGTADELVELLHNSDRLWAAAIVAQQDADRADGEVRYYAATNEALHRRLDELTDHLVDEARNLFAKSAADKGRRQYEDAWDLIDEWRIGAALWRWCLNPNVAFQRPSGRAIPAELRIDEYNAAVAIGERRIEIPMEGTIVTKNGTTTTMSGDALR